MLPNLFWFPNVLICNGWTSALVPFLLKNLSTQQKDLSKIKTVFLSSSSNSDVIFDSKNLPFDDGTISELKSLNLNQIGCKYADATLLVDNDEKFSNKIMKTKVFKDSKTCSMIDISKKEDEKSSLLLEKIEKVIKSL